MMDKKIKQVMSVANYLRHREGLKIDELSRKTGLSDMTISRIENGRFNVSIDKLQTLARHFGVTVDCILRNDFAAACATFTSPLTKSRKGYDAQLALAKKRLEIGFEGEKWVFEEELQRLANTIFANGINPNYADTSAFDMLTFNKNGLPMVVEVKTTTQDGDSFFMTRKEREVLEACVAVGIPYELRRVYKLNDGQKTYQQVITGEELLAKYEFFPTKYEVKRRAIG